MAERLSAPSDAESSETEPSDANPSEAEPSDDVPRKTPSRARRDPALLVVGALIGLAVALAAIASGPLSSDRLVRTLGGDAGSSFAALRYFVADSWRFPLLSTSLMTKGPGGHAGVVAFLDGIPALALTAKVLRPIGIGDVTWIRLWYGGCLVAQGVAAAWFCQVARIRRRSIAVALIVVLVCAPAMLLRFVHPGLFAQFELTLAWVVVARTQIGRSRRAAWWGIALLVLALLTHPYVFVMVATTLVGNVGWAVHRGRLGAGDALRLAVASVVTIVTVAFLCGYVPNRSVPAGGYGAFGVPPLSPVWPQWSGIVPRASSFITNSSGSVEGMNYLGLGGVAMLVVGLVVGRRRFVRIVEDGQVLAALLVILTAVAVTPVVYVTSTIVARPFGRDVAEMTSVRGLAKLAIAGVLVVGAVGVWIVRSGRWSAWRVGVGTIAVVATPVALLAVVRRSAVTDLLCEFRSSGRLFWVVGVGALALAAVLIDRWATERPDLPSRVVAGLAVALVLVQVVDVRFFVFDASDRMVAGSARSASVERLARRLDRAGRVHLASNWECFEARPELIGVFQDVVIAASMSGRPIDNYYGGRTAAPACPGPPVSVPTSRGQVNVFIDDGGGALPGGCSRLDAVVVCEAGHTR